MISRGIEHLAYRCCSRSLISQSRARINLRTSLLPPFGRHASSDGRQRARKAQAEQRSRRILERVNKEAKLKDGRNTGGKGIEVRYFEKDATDPNAKAVPSAENDAKLEKLAKLMEEVEKLEEQVQTMFSSDPTEGFGGEVDEVPDQAYLERSLEDTLKDVNLPPEQYKMMLSDLGMKEPEPPPGPHRILALSDLSAPGKIILTNLNKFMDAAAIASDTKVRHSLWRYYQRCKLYVPNFLRLLPEPAWSIIWQSQAEEDPLNPNRASHLRILAEDMEKAGRSLSREQRYGHLEGLFLEGKEDAALRIWEEGLSKGDGAVPEYLEMGIRMCCYTKNIVRAQEILETLLKYHTTWDPRIMITVLLTSVNAGESSRAWAIYMRLKERLGSKMTMEDYDKISIGFLHAGEKDFGLAVFRDMMLLGNKDKTAQRRDAGRRLSTFLSLSKDVDEVNELSTTWLTSLPRSYENKFFYGKWLKKLIGMGEIESALKVVELMYERGVKPDAKHVNGIVSAMLRSTAPKDRPNAVQLALSMVQSRLDQVRTRRGDPFKTETGLQQNDIMSLTNRIQAPSATIETFSLLAKHYLDRAMFDSANYLRELLVECEIKMDAFFMNNMLFNELKYRGARGMWSRFETMSQSVRPDPTTINTLWQGEALMLREKRKERHPFPLPRELFAITLAWFRLLRGDKLHDAREELSPKFTNDIVSIFLSDGDLSGAIVALHTLTRIMGIDINVSTVETIVAELGVHLNFQTIKRARRNFTEEPQPVLGSKNVALRLADIRRERAEEFAEKRGRMTEEMNDEWHADETVRCLIHLLRNAMERLGGGELDVAGQVSATAKEVGLEGFDLDSAMMLRA